MADTRYATERARADINGQRMERIFVKEHQQEEIRFSWWPNGKFVPRPLDLPEAELLELMALAIRERVLSADFADRLRAALQE